MKGQLPWSMERLRGQGIELFGRSEAFVSLLHHHLPFLNHVHEFDPNSRVLGSRKRFEPQHLPCHPLHAAMILFDNIIDFCHIPPDFVVDLWATDGESGSHHDFRF
jgi:hypothetical protein